jgi:hypothetical protein
MLTPDQIQGRAQAYLQSIPGQTLGLLGTCVALAVVDLVSNDLVTEALTLDRAPVIQQLHAQDPQTHRYSSVVILLVLSVFSTVHGFISVLLSVYFGKDLLSDLEKENRNPWAFLFGLGIKQAVTNLASLGVDWIWFLTFPAAWTRFAKVGGFGGLFPLVCFLEAEKSSLDPNGQAELPLLPFTVSKRAKPFMYAFFFSIIGGGDVDLFCAAVLGFLVAYANTAWNKISARVSRSPVRLPFVSPSTHGQNGPGNVEESTSLLPGTSVSSKQFNVATAEKGSDAEKRALLLAAAEKRLAEKPSQASGSASAMDSV